MKDLLKASVTHFVMIKASMTDMTTFVSRVLARPQGSHRRM